MRQETVITGMGLVLPCGTGLEAAGASWETGTPCFAPLPENLGTGLGAACTAFSASGIIPPMQSRRLDRPSRFAWVAAGQAFQDAGVDPARLGLRLGVAVGTMTGGNEPTEAFLRPYLAKGPEGASPMLFANCVAVAISGYLSTAFGIRGPSVTQLAREASALAALEQARRWLDMRLLEAVLVVGVDGLFPVLSELLHRTRLSVREGLPVVGSRRGLLPGEGAQAFLLETRDHAEARGARIRASLRGVAALSPATPEPSERSRVLAETAACLTPSVPDAWIGGSSGHRILDEVEAPLLSLFERWPRPRYPKTLWGEFCGSGGQLLAAALLDPGRRVLVTAPASFGCQYAAVLEKP
ncbi:MAG TPA: beta-ketoacyl synthase N-terminal-like domain-containing protein [Holophaga sp.]|nr:beta-ketoacyl synthase N-terminal-like domain-containing protein [Holophaga sp.]HPS67358.1 beta-ketoacyl synthase N-terminal-like domain-containing protein [Holophaga sp.]